MTPLRALVDRLSRRQKQAVMVCVDFFLLAFAVWAAFSLRLTVWFQPDAEQWVVIALAPLFAIPVFVHFGLYRSVIRYVGEQALIAVLKGMCVATLVWALALLYSGVSGFERVPRSLPAIYWFIGVFLVGGSRFFLRWLLGQGLRKKRKNVLIYGANDAGRELLASLKNSAEFWPVAFLDEDATFRGRAIDGVRVYGLHAFETLKERYGIEEAIILESAFSTPARKALIEQLKREGVYVRVLPAVSEIASGRVLVQALRSVEIEDLLGREPVPPMQELLAKNIEGKCVMITGAGGSIGSELARQIAKLSPTQLVLLDASEYNLYAIHQELEGRVAVIPVLANVCEAEVLTSIMQRYAPHTVYHAAAYKHVPLVEANAVEGIKNNVLGTLNMVKAALAAKVQDVVLISTDKAVRPTNVMGASKRLAELILQAYAKDGDTRFSMVRFGNVLGSSGSVVPLFRKQIKEGGPVTVTHADVTRYFMTIPEAAQLVIQAGAMADGGDVFVLDMGEPIKIMDLARRMIELSGKTVEDVGIVVTGLRPGEKLYEELLIGNAPEPTQHPRIFKAKEAALEKGALENALGDLSQALQARDEHSASRSVMELALAMHG